MALCADLRTSLNFRLIKQNLLTASEYIMHSIIEYKDIYCKLLICIYIPLSTILYHQYFAEHYLGLVEDFLAQIYQSLL